MKIKLENREYELQVNGMFMKKYQETFKENMIMALYKCTQEKDPLACAQLTYCAIQEELPFDEWLNSFEKPLFILDEMDNILNYLVTGIEPSVEAKSDPTEIKPEGEEVAKKKRISR